MFKHPVLLFSCAWWTVALIIPFWGDFPLNDDWAYAQNVYFLSEKGQIRFNAWPAMTLLTQTFWGAVFCKIFGFSHTILRLSTLVLTWIGGIYLIKLTRYFQASSLASLLIALTWTFNPLCFSLSYTYMTEMPFISLSIIAVYLYVRFLENKSIRTYLSLVICTILATLLRQTGIFIALFAMVGIILSEKPKLRNLFLAGLVPLVNILILSFYIKWRTSSGSLPPQWGSIYIAMRDVLNGGFIQPLQTKGGILIFYSGYLMLPLSVLSTYQSFLKGSKPKLFIALGLACMLCWYWFYKNEVWRMLPLSGIFHNFGLGPKVLIDTHLGFNLHPMLSTDSLHVLFMVGILAALLLLTTLFHNVLNIMKLADQKNSRIFIVNSLLSAMSYLIYLMVDINFFDRYFLTFCLFVLLSFIPFISSIPIKDYSKTIVLAGLVWIIMVGFSIMATHDYLSWNRQRWNGLHYLMDSLNISPQHIDGGFEFNGWHQTFKERRHVVHSTSWWFVDRDDYAVSFGKTQNYDIIKKYPFHAWLTGDLDTIYLLNRPTPKQRDTLRMDMEQHLFFDTSLFIYDDVTINLDTTLKSERLARSGKYTLQFDELHRNGWKISIPVHNPYDEIRFSCWVFGDPVHFNGLKGETHWITHAPDSMSWFAENNYNTRDSSGWYFKEHRVIIPPGYKDSTIVGRLYFKGQGAVWIDDIEVIQIKY